MAAGAGEGAEAPAADLLEALTCSICQALFTRPVSCMPCLHSFCAGCVSRWIEERRGAPVPCPQCRAWVDEVRPNHTLGSVVGAVVRKAPHLAPSAGAALELRLLDCIGEGRRLTRRRRAASPAPAVSNSSASSASSDEDSSPRLGPGSLSTSASETSSSTTTDDEDDDLPSIAVGQVVCFKEDIRFVGGRVLQRGDLGVVTAVRTPPPSSGVRGRFVQVLARECRGQAAFRFTARPRQIAVMRQVSEAQPA
eukprot:TRINITY_DN2172_c0_g1_i1.p1 TRINITY_DN2172_c0_g1~~TRINITY_DN2172_c0_g1_i1.p1  ORF type:complete len:275 (+),score=77.79 TRINITY_DN2172_c0_g1_i1:71-826(+)